MVKKKGTIWLSLPKFYRECIVYIVINFTGDWAKIYVHTVGVLKTKELEAKGDIELNKHELAKELVP